MSYYYGSSDSDPYDSESSDSKSDGEESCEVHVEVHYHVHSTYEINGQSSHEEEEDKEEDSNDESYDLSPPYSLASPSLTPSPSPPYNSASPSPSPSPLSSPLQFRFGVELELIGYSRQFYQRRRDCYADLADAVSSSEPSVDAIADNLNEQYRKHPEHYDKWFITKDGSLGDPEDGVPLEAVSPILLSTYPFVPYICAFWEGWDKVFHYAKQDTACSTHVHISPAEGEFSCSQLLQIAKGICYLEPFVLKTLPQHRRDNTYCQPNTKASRHLSPLEIWGQWECLDDAAESYANIYSVMQEDSNGEMNRRVLWNFANACCEGGSGSIEFRGAPGSVDAADTILWILFVLGIVKICLDNDPFTLRCSIDNMDSFWTNLILATDAFPGGDRFPCYWEQMPS